MPRALMLERRERAAHLGEALSAALRPRTIDLDRVLCGAELAAALERFDYLCVVIEAGGETDEDHELFDSVHRGRPDVPVVVVADRDVARERLAWLDRGADDAVSPLVDPGELAARVDASVRRLQQRNVPRATVCGALTMHPDRRIATWKGEPVSLTNKEYALLEILVRDARRVHSRDDLHAALCGERSLRASNAVDVYVHSLRRKLHANLIRTVRGSGYRLDAHADGH